uniref:Kinesin-like protein n=2 Tax=Spongospora subterranea TaxID=70186 RepID=A0A0H5R533_9EUKA|eukprot:CRZ09253.1 hypothetical protein [Spongospora subterranea]
MSGHAVKVVVRCRPFSDAETKGRHSTVISCNNKEKQVTVHSEVRGQETKKTYTFDSVFGEFSQQESVFDDISGIVDEVLEGFNCTVFAYGQTGTGKTYTMQGPFMNGDRTVECGIIPRAIHAIFDRLRAKDVNECVVHVSCLEIYNEEICDLLSDNTEVDLRIFDDVVKGVFVSNLEEVLVVDPTEIFTVLTRSWDRRRTAETKMNAASSRSHTIFTVKVHTKETTVDGEDIIKIGKLNLVDLAGSECVGKSEAVGQRAKEAGNINRSLLTLGRVINALVQGQRHIPYRESKLTRLLQESLGGKAKTILIATISPSQRAIEETLKTLEYAHTAKNILNRPEVNQKVTQKTFVRDLQVNMNMIKKQLEAQRTKTGVYLPVDQYDALQHDLLVAKNDAERNAEQVEAVRQELESMSESNQRIRDEAKQQKEASLKQLADLQTEMDRQLAAWQAKYAQQSDQLQVMTEERDAALDAVDRRNVAMAEAQTSLTSCHASCGTKISEIRLSLDQLMAHHTQQAKIASDDARKWSGHVASSIKCMQDEANRITSDLMAGVASTLQFCTSTCQQGGPLRDNLTAINGHVDAIQEKITTGVAEIAQSFQAHIDRVQNCLVEHEQALSSAAETYSNSSQAALSSMQEHSTRLEEIWGVATASMEAYRNEQGKSFGILQNDIASLVQLKRESSLEKARALAQNISSMIECFAKENDSNYSEVSKQVTTTLDDCISSSVARSDEVQMSIANAVSTSDSIRNVERSCWSEVMKTYQQSSCLLSETLKQVPRTTEVVSNLSASLKDAVHGQLSQCRSASEGMFDPIQAIFAGSAAQIETSESQCRQVRDTIASFTTQAVQQSSNHVTNAIATQDQVETANLRYREQHHLALGEIQNSLDVFDRRPSYSSPSKQRMVIDSTNISTKARSGRVKRPREISLEEGENKRPTQ